MAKRKAPTTRKTRTPKTPTRARAQHASAPTLPVDEDIFIPASFGQHAAPSCNGVTPDDGTSEDVFIPATFGQHAPEPEPERFDPTDRAAQFDRARELDRLGFTERGICKYGCRGMESPNVPLVGWHLRTCAFWTNLFEADANDLP